MLAPEIAWFLRWLDHQPRPAWAVLSPERFRLDMELFAKLAGPGPAMARLDTITIAGGDGDLAARVYRPRGAPAVAPVLVYFHGGGFCVGSLDTHDTACRQLADRAGVVLVSVDYRLAPEHPFPAQYDDACASTRWVYDHAAELELDRDRLAVGGDSAGANLAAAVALWARDDGLPVRFQLLVYPGVDGTASLPSRQDKAEGYYLTAAAIDWFRSHHLPPELGIDPTDARHSPLHATSLRGVAPAFVLVMENDPLRDEGGAYADRLRADRVPTEVRLYRGQIHGLFGMEQAFPCVRAQMDDAADAVRRALIG